MFAAYTGLEIMPTYKNTVGSMVNTYVDVLAAFAPQTKPLDELKAKHPKTKFYPACPCVLFRLHQAETKDA